MATLSGVVKDSGGAFISRPVRVYRRSDGGFVGQAMSNASTGVWSVTTEGTAPHFAIVHDTSSGNANSDKLGLGLHFNGANNSIVFGDVAGNIITPLGNAKISTAQYAQGVSSGLFDGTGDGLFIPDHARLRPGSGDFSLRFAQRYVSLSGYQTLYSKGYSVSGGFFLQTGNGDGKIRVYVGSGTLVATETGSTVSTNTWYDVEVERTSGTITIRRNGTSYGSGSNSTDLNATSNVYIGGGSVTGFDAYYFNGYFDEFEFYAGVSPTPHTSRSSEFLDIAVGGAENALIFDMLVPV